MKPTIWSVAGGGIRGIIPCCAMVEIERQTGKQIRDLAAMLAGTSTGALLVSALAAGLPAWQILTIYTKRAKEIFTPPEPLATGKMLASGSRYKATNIEKVLRSELGKAASWTLNDCPVPILLTAMDIRRHPWYFVRDNPRNARTTGKLSLVDCAVASACAPTYFPSWDVAPLAGTVIPRCFDGGIGVTGNPCHRACVEAFHYDSLDPAGTRLFTFGTGYCPDVDVNPPSGFVATALWTIDTLTGAPEDEQTGLVDLYYPGIQTVFDVAMPTAISMADIGSIPELVQLGQQAAPSRDWAALLE